MIATAMTMKTVKTLGFTIPPSMPHADQGME
jgi:hypothetical protein